MVDVHRFPSYVIDLYVFNHELQGRVSVICILFNRIADIKRFHPFNMRAVLVHSESDAMDGRVRFVVYQFQLDMFQFFADQLACPVIFHVQRAKYRFLVVRTERIHLFQFAHELGIDVFQVENGVDVDLRDHLFGDNLVGSQLQETFGKFIQIFFFQGKAGGIGMSPEVFQQVTAVLYCLINVETGNRAGRTGDQFG